jgi:hypothetical protein
VLEGEKWNVSLENKYVWSVASGTGLEYRWSFGNNTMSQPRYDMKKHDPAWLV